MSDAPRPTIPFDPLERRLRELRERYAPGALPLPPADAQPSPRHWSDDDHDDDEQRAR